MSTIMLLVCVLQTFLMDIVGLSCFDNQPSDFVCINECHNMFSASVICAVPKNVPIVSSFQLCLLLCWGRPGPCQIGRFCSEIWCCSVLPNIMLKSCQVLRYMTLVRMQKTCPRSVLGSLGNRSMSHGHLDHTLLWEEDWMATNW